MRSSLDLRFKGYSVMKLQAQRCNKKQTLTLKKEIWDLVIVPFWRSQSSSLSPFSDAAMSNNFEQLQRLFVSPARSILEVEKYTETFNNLYDDALGHKLTSILSECKDKDRAKDRKEMLEKMEVHVFLKKVKAQECLNPEDVYVKTAEQVLTRLKKEVQSLDSQNSLRKEVQGMEIPDGLELTVQQYTSLAKIIHLLEAEAALAGELLALDLKDINGAQELLDEIQGVTQLSDDQRKKLVTLVNTCQPKSAAILLDPIESAESMGLKHDLVKSRAKKRDEAEEHHQRESAERQRDLRQKDEALDWLTDKNRHTSQEVRQLIIELREATKMSDDQKERLKALQAEQSSAIRMYTKLWWPIALLWWSGCPQSDGM